LTDFYDEVLSGWDDVEPSSGLSSEPVPVGYYAAKIEKVLEKKESSNGVPVVRMQLQITRGKYARRAVFVDMSLSASPVDRDGNKRSTEAFKKANDNVQGMAKGFIRTLNVAKAPAIGEGSAKIFNFYNVDAWEGREFVAKLSIQPEREYNGKTYGPRNQLANFYPMNDAKHGIAYIEQLEQQGNSASTTPATL